MIENKFAFKKLVVGVAITRQLNLKTKPTEKSNVDTFILVNQFSQCPDTNVAFPIRMFATEEDVCGIVDGDIGKCIIIWSTRTVKVITCSTPKRHSTNGELEARYGLVIQLDDESATRLTNYIEQVETIMTECLQDLTSTETINYNIV